MEQHNRDIQLLNVLRQGLLEAGLVSDTHSIDSSTELFLGAALQSVASSVLDAAAANAVEISSDNTSHRDSNIRPNQRSQRSRIQPEHVFQAISSKLYDTRSNGWAASMVSPATQPNSSGEDSGERNVLTNEGEKRRNENIALHSSDRASTPAVSRFIDDMYDEQTYCTVDNNEMVQGVNYRPNQSKQHAAANISSTKVIGTLALMVSPSDQAHFTLKFRSILANFGVQLSLLDLKRISTKVSTDTVSQQLLNIQSSISASIHGFQLAQTLHSEPAVVNCVVDRRYIALSQALELSRANKIGRDTLQSFFNDVKMPQATEAQPCFRNHTNRKRTRRLREFNRIIARITTAFSDSEKDLATQRNNTCIAEGAGSFKWSALESKLMALCVAASDFDEFNFGSEKRSLDDASVYFDTLRPDVDFDQKIESDMVRVVLADAYRGVTPFVWQHRDSTEHNHLDSVPECIYGILAHHCLSQIQDLTCALWMLPRVSLLSTNEFIKCKQNIRGKYISYETQAEIHEAYLQLQESEESWQQLVQRKASLNTKTAAKEIAKHESNNQQANASSPLTVFVSADICTLTLERTAPNNKFHDLTSKFLNAPVRKVFLKHLADVWCHMVFTTKSKE